jgi:hypothetical protein
MCGCNDIGADPGKMGAHGHEGDGGCECEGLTMRGRHWIVFDTQDKAQESRRALAEDLNYPPTLAFATDRSTHRSPHSRLETATDRSKPPVAAGAFSALSAAMPANVKLMTLTSNYAAHSDGALLLRLSHLYSVGEHPTLSAPATVSLSALFAKPGLAATAVAETMLTGDRKVTSPFRWKTKAANDAVAAALEEGARKRSPAQCAGSGGCEGGTVPLDPHDPTFTVTLMPMEIKTFLVRFGDRPAPAPTPVPAPTPGGARRRRSPSPEPTPRPVPVPSPAPSPGAPTPGPGPSGGGGGFWSSAPGGVAGFALGGVACAVGVMAVRRRNRAASGDGARRPLLTLMDPDEVEEY